MSLEAAFIYFPEITTDHLFLRQLRLSDAEALFAIFSDAETMRYNGGRVHASTDETRHMIERYNQRYEQRSRLTWVITQREKEDVIGSCGFHHFDPEYTRAEIGYNLKRDKWGQGIMAKALHPVLTFGFNDLGLHRIEAIIEGGNSRSKGLLLRMGFIYEGCLRERFFINDRFEDEYYYGLLKQDWQRQVGAQD